jgi:hypothetical protein
MHGMGRVKLKKPRGNVLKGKENDNFERVKQTTRKNLSVKLKQTTPKNLSVKLNPKEFKDRRPQICSHD